MLDALQIAEQLQASSATDKKVFKNHQQALKNRQLYLDIKAHY
ncbi:hypothetical protein HHE03_15000 [Helicobacter heilmannii]|nr:hypothetical protein [Helicobacter heilmannii]CRF49827.1 hypothetical protein HHE03_15000 [Helicobacter heilmannii]